MAGYHTFAHASENLVSRLVPNTSAWQFVSLFWAEAFLPLGMHEWAMEVFLPNQRTDCSRLNAKRFFQYPPKPH